MNYLSKYSIDTINSISLSFQETAKYLWLYFISTISKLPSCFTTLNSGKNITIFRFSDFIAARALLVIIYTITDYRYKFRIASTHWPLRKLTFYIIILIGLQSLVLELWKSQGWYVLKSSCFTQVEWQIFWAFIFLITIILWIKVAFLSPPILSRNNYKQYGNELYKCILRGNEEELKVIADELSLSANSLITNSVQMGSNHESDFSKYAHDTLLLIGDPKFCKAIVNFSPGTIVALMEPILRDKKSSPPIGQFLLNVTTEALKNKNSFLYVEKQGADSGLMGYLRPVSNTMFSDYELLSRLKSGLSPIDISYKEYEQWDSEQWDAYCKIVLIIFKDFIESGHANTQEPSFIYGIFHVLEHPLFSLSKVIGSNDFEEKVITQKLEVICDFVQKLVVLLDTTKNTPVPLKRVREHTFPKNIYDYLALFIIQIIYYSSWVNSSEFICWYVQHNVVWSDLMDPMLRQSNAWKIVHFKVRRLIYDEITGLFSSPDFKSARILGYCLYIFGLEQTRRTPYSRFAKLILTQTQNNYLSLRDKLPDVAQTVLIGTISFQEDENRLVRTAVTKGLEKELQKQYLNLNPIN